MLHQEDFLNIANLLRRGKFICDITHPSAYRLLSDPDTLEQCNAFFAPFDECITCAGSNDAFFLTHLNPEGEVAKDSTKKIIHDFHSSGMRFVIYFFDDLHRILQDDQVFFPGFTFLYSDLLSRIQNSETHKSQLNELANLVGTAHREEPRQLSAILDKMVSYGCLVLVDKNDHRFQVTGKMAYLRALMEFIAPFTVPAEVEEENGGEELQHDLFGASA